jgi:hypothetical protein
MSAFADEVRNHPMLFSLLDVFDSEPGYLRSSEATAEENGDHGIVAFGTQAFLRRTQRGVASPRQQSTNFRSAYHGSLRPSPAGFQPQGRGSGVRNGSLVRQPPNGSETKVDSG